tara:strand:+ start:3466 stop:4146 length:681 start_codon:yes stop_codon:yes gene_type:complete
VKNVFISGSTKGIGKAIAVELASKNFNIFLHGRSNRDLRKLAKKIKKNNQSNVKIISADFSKEKDLIKVCNFLKKNSVQIIINNAGQYINGNIEETSLKDIKNLFQINFFSNFFIIKNFVKWKKDNFVIININSFAGKNSSENEVAYAATKHSLYSLSKSLKAEFIGKKVKIIDLFLSAVKTRITLNRKNYKELIDPKDIASLIYDLLTKYSSLQASEVNIFKNKS